jgi:hypothetical protein
MIQKERIARGTQDVEKLINKLTSGKSFQLRYWNEKRDLDAKNADIDEVRQVLATLISDLKLKGIIQGE